MKSKKIVIFLIIFFMSLTILVVINKIKVWTQMPIDDYLREDIVLADSVKFQEMLYVDGQNKPLHIVFFVDMHGMSYCVVLEEEFPSYKDFYFAKELDVGGNQISTGSFHVDDILVEFEWGVVDPELEDFIFSDETIIAETEAETIFDASTQDNFKRKYFYNVNLTEE